MSRDLALEVDGLLQGRQWKALRTRLEGERAPDVAELIASLPPADRLVLFRLLPRELAGDAFAELGASAQEELVGALSDEETRHLVTELEPDERTQALVELPGRLVQRLLNALPTETLAETRSLLGYPQESVGRLMTPRYVAVRRDWTVASALEHVRRRAESAETIAVIMVVDDEWHLLDTLSLERFVVAEPQERVADILDRDLVAIEAMADREDAVELIQRYDLVVLPVVDAENVLVGIVTVDDILDVAEREATEDFHKVAAVAPLAVPYPEAGVRTLFRRRIVWLLVLVFVNLLSSGVIAAFEETLATTIALAFFLPLLIDSGGNTGAQSATMMVRAIATGDLPHDQWRRTLVKELGVGAALGLSMGVASALLGVLRAGPALGAVVGLSMAAIVLLTNLVGAMLPFVLTRLRVDPAVASSPLITTMADAGGLLIYFSIAGWILGSVA
jgi:magnesium transporter